MSMAHRKSDECTISITIHGVTYSAQWQHSYTACSEMIDAYLGLLAAAGFSREHIAQDIKQLADEPAIEH